MLAIIGGDPNRFRTYVDLYLQTLNQLGMQPQPIGVHSHGYISNSDGEARDQLWPDYKTMRDRIGAERGWPPMQRTDFDREIDHGSLYVGSPETVSRKIVSTAKMLSLSRFDMKYSAGELSHERIMGCISFYGEKVILVCVKYWHPEQVKKLSVLGNASSGLTRVRQVADVGQVPNKRHPHWFRQTR